MRKTINIVSVFLIILTTAICAGYNSGLHNEVATVGSIIISDSEFLNTYSILLSKYGLNDSRKLRQETLHDLIRDKILYLYALEAGLDSTEEAKQEIERIRLQTLLNSFISTELAPEIKITGSDLIESYRRMNTKLKVRQIYSRNKEGIDSLYALLTEGTDFNTLARNSYTNESLKNKNGLLGYIGYDELHPALEEAAYSLNPGEYSMPVKTSTGYSIIRVEDIFTIPVLSDIDFLNKKQAISALVNKKKQELYFRQYVHDIINSLGLVYNIDVLDKLWHHYNRTNHDAIEPASLISEPAREDVLLTCSHFLWTVEDFHEKSFYTSADQKRMVRDRDGLIEFINGLAARDEILRIAEYRGLTETIKFKAELNKKIENYLIGEAEKAIGVSIIISDDDARQYYNQNIHLFSIPQKIKLHGILLNDKPSHDFVLDELNNGNSFSFLAEQYSIQRQTAVNGGELGYFTREELGQLGDELFLLKTGQYEGGFEMEGKYLIALCAEKTVQSAAGFEEVKDRIRADLRSYALKNEIEKFTSARKSILDIQVNEEMLKSLNLSQTQ